MKTLIQAALACLMVFSLPAFADNQSPSTVNGVKAIAVSGPGIYVSWHGAWDDQGIDGYNIYRDNVYLTTIGNTTNYTDRSIKANQQYSYSVVAFDKARNFSTASESRSATSHAGKSNASASNSSTGKPSIPVNLTHTIINDSTARLSWDAPPGGADGYNLYKNGSYYTTVRGRNEYVASFLNWNKSYDFQIVAFRNGEFSALSQGIAIRTATGASTSPHSDMPTTPTSSSTQPSAPTGLRADNRNGSSVKLHWNAPPEGAEGYNIILNNGYHKTVKGSTSFTAQGLDINSSYTFNVVAFHSGKFSTASSPLSVPAGQSRAASPPPANKSNSASAVPDGYSLVFSEEFDRWSIDSSKWNTSYRWGADWIINGEEQRYVDILKDPEFGVNPFKFNGDKLTIEATRTPDWLKNKSNGQQYLSGAMTTYNRFSMKYGYVEMRAMLPSGKGLWPAFWLLHETDDWRKPEIDVMEMLGGNPRVVYQTYHHYNNGTLRSTPSFEAPGPDYSSDFHTFGMLWEPGSITWYVDGQKTNSFQSAEVADESMYLLLNLALGGFWAASPDGSTPFPARFQIDYVRAYQRR